MRSSGWLRPTCGVLAGRRAGNRTGGDIGDGPNPSDMTKHMDAKVFESIVAQREKEDPMGEHHPLMYDRFKSFGFRMSQAIQRYDREEQEGFDKNARRRSRLEPEYYYPVARSTIDMYKQDFRDKIYKMQFEARWVVFFVFTGWFFYVFGKWIT